jgi:hypothetical protein
LLRDDRSRSAIAVVERYVDGAASDAEMEGVRIQASRLSFEATTRRDEPADAAYARKAVHRLVAANPAQDGRAVCEVAWRVASAVAEAAGLAAGEPPPPYGPNRQLPLLRDVFGNPYLPGRVAPSVLAWGAGTLQRLVLAAYEDRRLPEGTLDPSRLSLLADALEDAGCTDANLLGHLRGPGPHVRGCWAVDLVLGRA